MAGPDPDDLLAGLDDGQRAAVTSDALPLGILAGAGSGKTRVLTRRIAWRCATGRDDPRRVLALTFTRAAARELASRLRTLGIRDTVRTGTFHAVALAELRAWHAARRMPAPVLLDRPARLVARVVDARGDVISDVVGEIGWARARLVTAERYPAEARRAGREPKYGLDGVARAFGDYEAEKRKRGVMDFDDLLGRWAEIQGRDPEAAAAQQWRFSHLYVDEFQDVNPLQFRLLEAWRAGRPNLCVVGDPNQAIYGWNGADAGFLDRFTEVYAGGEVLVVDRSYRSTPEVLAVANAVLDAGGRSGVRLRAVRGEGPAPVVVRHTDDLDEARVVARLVLDAHAPGTPWSHQAVLVRTNAQLALFETAFRAVGIPHRVRGRAPLIDHPAVRDALRELTVPNRGFAEGLSLLDAQQENVEDDERRGVVERLLVLADEYQRDEHRPDAMGFKAWLLAETDDDRRPADAVELVTFHAAKGLEWPIVYVCGLEDGYVPSAHARSPEAAAEERRLLYVACTRAERVLRLSWAASRTMGMRPVRRRPSPYLAELQPVLDLLASRAAPADWREHLPKGRAALAGRRDESADARAALVAWRAARARAAGVPDHAVLPDHAVAALARARPIDLDALTAVEGTRPLVVAGLADDVLAVLAGAAEQR